MKTNLLHNTISILLMTSSLLMAKSITVAGTADLQGMMEPSQEKIDLHFDGKKDTLLLGGIDRIATVFAQLKEKNSNTIFVTTGDDLMNRFFHTYKGKAIMSLMSDAGYDFIAFGNHEFDKGSQVLADAVSDMKSERICSDLNVENSPLKGKCLPYSIKEIDGVKIGLFSLMTENFPMVTSEKAVTMRGDNITIAKKMVALLQQKDVDVIVLLSHIGYKEDRELAKRVKGIDLIFGGHSHEYVKEMGRANNTAIVNGGEKGSQVVVVNIPLDENNKVIRKDITMSKIPVTQDILSNKQIAQKVAEYVKKFPPATVLGKTKAEWNMNSSETRKGESNVADMINDMMRTQFKADIVLNNGGAFRGKKVYLAGDVTDTMLKEIDEFGNYAFLLNLKGKYIKPILERGAASYGEGGFMQVSGIKYRITLSKQPQILEGEKVVTKGERVDNVKILIDGKWQELDLDKEYKVLSNSFIVKDGGDGFFWFKKYGTNLQNTYSTFYSIMADYLYQEKFLTPKTKDGRIEIRE